MQGIVLGVRFLLELGMLVGLSNWGFQAENDSLALFLGIVAPVAAASVWGVFVSPRGRARLPIAQRQALALILFALGGAGFAASGSPAPGVVFVAAAVVDTVLVRMWRLEAR